jgi:hypothetical protein
MRMIPASGQTRALLRLRWRMVREPASRFGLALLGGAAAGLLIGAVITGAGFSEAGDRSFGVALVMPSLLLGFAVSAVLSPLAAGGGNQLFPPEQLAAYPLRPTTQFRSSLILVPLNLAWLVQVIALSGATAFITGPGQRLLLALLVTGSYIVFATVAGQAAAWWIVGVRQSRLGRLAVLAAATVLIIVGSLVIITDRVTEVLDASPTTIVVRASAAAYAGDLTEWLPLVLGHVVLTLVAYRLGVRACSWMMRRPSSVSQSSDARVLRRRTPALTDLGEMLAVDRANVWRSTSLRRGLYVLGILPGLVAAIAGVRWVDLALLPALAAAGAGMLFGVNAFCLDSSGALWLASLPSPPRHTFLVRAATVLEVGLFTVALAAGAGSLRAQGTASLASVLATLCCAASAVVWVTATCMRLSISRPHRADLRGPRDTPAPPGAMAVYSARLAAGTTMLGLAFVLAARLGDPVLPLIVTTAVLLMSVRSLIRSRRMWEDPGIRARVVATVSSG